MRVLVTVLGSAVLAGLLSGCVVEDRPYHEHEYGDSYHYGYEPYPSGYSQPYYWYHDRD